MLFQVSPGTMSLNAHKPVNEAEASVPCHVPSLASGLHYGPFKALLKPVHR